MKKLIIIFLSILLITACNPDLDVVVPDFGDNSILGDTNPLPEEIKPFMEGIYRVTSGSEYFGSQVVIKWSRNQMSVFAEKNAGYFILEGGSLGSVLFFEGYWRYARNTETGLGRFEVSADEGGEYLLEEREEVPIILRGTFGTGDEMPTRDVVLEYDRYFSETVLNKKFFIIAHRGGGRTSDMLPASENTMEILELTERYGGNAVEIDVMSSQDGIPFLYHDRTVNLRLTQKGPVWGNIEDFTFAQLRTSITLINGEKIPSLRDALEYILEETTIELVWLDMKSGKNDFPIVIPIQKEIMERAEGMGRQLEIFSGLPTEEKIDHFLATEGHDEVLSLCELEVADVHRVDANFWGPRWTLGMQTDEVEQMHAEGRRVITWTMDVSAYIERYLKESKFDGFVTNYPTLVSYYLHMLE